MRPSSVVSIADDLRMLGVAAGDLVMVHTSMRALGPIEGGAEGLVAALDLAVGPSGTVLVNVGVRDDWSWVNDRPEHERAQLLAGADPFDALTTPADPDNGVVAEVFRTAPGTLVSDHPEGRFAARGALAAELVADVPWDDYYGPGSPLERFVERGGRVLRLGADEDTVTLLHYAEHLVPLEGKRRVRRHRLVATPGGPAPAEVRAVSTLDDSAGIVPVPDDAEDYFATILVEYLRSGAASTGRVGHARAELIDGADIVRFATAWMARHLPELAMRASAEVRGAPG